MLFCTDPMIKMRKLYISSNSKCWTCGAVAFSQFCGCSLACYCDEACQRADLPRHKPACILVTVAHAAGVLEMWDE
jgi:hypothetical protein